MILVLATWLAVSLLVITLSFGRQTALWVIVIASLTVLPRRLTGNSSTGRSDIAAAAPELYTYSALLAIAVVVVWLVRKRPHLLLVFIGYIAVGAFLVWSPSDEVLAGVLHFGVGAAGWIVGVYLAPSLLNPRTARHLSIILMAVVAIQVLVAVLQILGLSLFEINEETQSFVVGRANGTLNHPNTLGKVLILTLVLGLLLSRSEDAKTSSLARMTLLGSLIPLILTGGRANLVGALLTLTIWVLIQPRQRRTRGVVVFTSALLCIALAALSTVLARFDEDPTGGSRERLLGVALQQIEMRPWAGTGPNSWITVVGRFDDQTAQGLPVHNSFLLGVGELGAVGAILLFTPWLLLIGRGFRLRSVIGMRGDAARATLASAPMITIIGMTGWGLIAGSILPLWFLVNGVLAGLMSTGGQSGDTQSALASVSRQRLSRRRLRL